ncbi:MAG: UDP-3-O-(3-hydroxymyristoyl)glucosamine N-acyltransferase [Spirochaetota bacterium]|jgi:UDP-3-O-[3-hydroxymyristoyl] glucosamine N-acyltransferase|nr:UDP-3-O-(3-hydroxymyristoyl)glucosamine N-acyltransferase [Spirochaetota bacterium]
MILLGDLALRLGAIPADKYNAIQIHGIGTPASCREGDVVYAADPANYRLALQSPCAAIIIGEGFEKSAAEKPLLVAPDARLAFITCLEIFAPRAAFDPGISPEASIRAAACIASTAVVMERVSVLDGAAIGERSVLYPGVFIGQDASIGADCILYPNVVIRERCVLGDRVIIHAGTVIGADGFGYVQNPDGSHRKIPQIGNVIIEDDVEIGANSAVDRAACGSTRIGRGTKIDNLVQVAHNVELGRHNILAAQVGIAGSSTTGASCIFGGQAGIVDHCDIPERVTIGPQAGFQRKHTQPGSVYLGSPAIEMEKFRRILSCYLRLPELFGKRDRRRQE